jgi:hypothetical protein
MNVIRRSVAVTLVAVLAAGLAACSRDEEVKSAMAELDTFSSSIVKKVKGAPNPKAGVDAAQQYLDANKGPLQQKLAGIKDLRGFQVTEETRKKLEASFMNNAMSVAGLQLEYVSQAAMDNDFNTKLEKLVTDYKNAVTQ